MDYFAYFTPEKFLAIREKFYVKSTKPKKEDLENNDKVMSLNNGVYKTEFKSPSSSPEFVKPLPLTSTPQSRKVQVPNQRSVSRFNNFNNFFLYFS